MPIYEYACRSCGHHQEALQGINEPPLTECAECHEPMLTRLVSAAGFRLKGGGWYETDFKKDSDKKKNLVDGDSSSGSSTSHPPGGSKGNTESTTPSKESTTAPVSSKEPSKNVSTD